MKKKLLAIILSSMLALSCVGCGTTYQEAITSSSSESFGNGYFTTITEWNDASNNYRIVYANDTKVKYFTVTTGYKFGITPLYNSDGTLQLFEE